MPSTEYAIFISTPSHDAKDYKKQDVTESTETESSEDCFSPLMEKQRVSPCGVVKSRNGSNDDDTTLSSDRTEINDHHYQQYGNRHRSASESCLLDETSRDLERMDHEYEPQVQSDYQLLAPGSSTGESYPPSRKIRRRYSLLGLCGTQTDGIGRQRRFSMVPQDNNETSNSSLTTNGLSQTADDDATSPGEPDFEVVMSVVNSWELLKSIDGYEDMLAEQIILRMIELDCHVREDLKLPSLRSPSQFNTIKEKLIRLLDGFVSFLGPDLEDFYDDVREVGRRYRDDGFKEYLLTSAVTAGLKFVIPQEDFPIEIERGWTIVLNFLVSKMA